MSPSRASGVEITLFPKKCHLHKIAMTWESPERAAWIPELAGWRCPKCVIVCPTHGDPLRSGHVGEARGLRCRRCHIAKLKKTKPRAHTFTKSGIAIVMRAAP